MATYVSKKASGKKRKMNVRDERQIRRLVEKHRKMSCKKLRVLYNSFSDKTISEITMRRKHERLGFRGRAASKKLLLKAKHRSTRRKWCGERSARTTAEWNMRVFSDECRFCLRSDGRVWVTLETMRPLPQVYNISHAIPQ